jgi:hypothetical protein
VPSSRAYFVSCPIALYPATSAAERLSFRQVNRRTGHRAGYLVHLGQAGLPLLGMSRGFPGRSCCVRTESAANRKVGGRLEINVSPKPGKPRDAVYSRK